MFSAGDKKAHYGIAIGDFILDVTELEAEGAFDLSTNPLFSQGRWNDFMALK